MTPRRLFFYAVTSLIMISAPELPVHLATPAAAKPRPTVQSTAEPTPGVSPATNWFMRDLLLCTLTALLALAATATLVRQWQHRQACVQVANDFTRGAAAFRAYASQFGIAPPDSLPGEVPDGMESFLASAVWTAASPVGGAYQWIRTAPGPTTPASPIVGRITLTAFAPSPPLRLQPADLLEIDRRIDDGNLATGDFRLGFNGWPVLIVRRSKD